MMVNIKELHKIYAQTKNAKGSPFGRPASQAEIAEVTGRGGRTASAAEVREVLRKVREPCK